MSVRFCGVLAILSVTPLLSASAQHVPKRDIAFTEFVAAQLRREIGAAAVVVKGPLTLAIGNVQANLDRIFAFCNRDSAGCAREISAYVKGAAEVHKEGLAPPSKEAIRIIVRTRAYVTAAQAALPKEAPKLQPREIADGLVMLAAIDTPRTIRLLTEKDSQALGLSADEIFKLGLANLRAHLKPLMEVAKIAQPGQIAHLRGDVYHSSRIALHGLWSPLVKAHGGKLIVAVPAIDTVLYVGDDRPAAIEALRTLARRAGSGAPSPLSGELLRWTPTRWEVVR